MPRQLAAILCVAFVIWLFRAERKARPEVSGALWIPLIWLVIISSRPISFWFGGGLQVETVDDYLDGSPTDRIIFLLLILSGLVVLSRRPANWGEFFRSNAWIVAFFVYWGVSTLWSEFTFVSFKRWIKDLGNVVMVLVILTDKNPVQAIKTVFARVGFVVIPFSVLFIKYYPEYGRIYNRWTWEVMYTGVATEKNALGCVVMVCSLFVIYGLMGEKLGRTLRSHEMPMKWAQILILLMALWLFQKAESSTALVCLMIGASILFALRSARGMWQMRNLKTYVVTGVVGVILLVSIPGLLGGMLGLLGEDATLTGRTDIWKVVLAEPINPVLGTGYYSFWLGDRVDVYWEKWSFRPNQSHNGYIETYLNGGLVALAILLVIVCVVGSRLKNEVFERRACSTLFFACLVVAVLYNWTEAVYNRLSPIWVVFLLVALRPNGLTRIGVATLGEDSEGEGRGDPGCRRDASLSLDPTILPATQDCEPGKPEPSQKYHR